jgi:outer membrane protein assembly factor BamE (lipoprotein component of BamABCDE complex)
MQDRAVFAVVSSAVAVLALAGCQSPRADSDAQRSNLTAGMVKAKIEKGATTQTEVLEVFGPPDLVTHKDGVDVWTYDKTSYDLESHNSYFTVLVAGASSRQARSSSTSTMLILYFDERDVVSDYRLSAVKF